MNHGVYVSQQTSSVTTPAVAQSGIPYVVGLAPVQMSSAAAVKTPVLCASWDDAVDKLGYSDDWKAYPLCEFMYSHFKLYGCQPVIFYNALDPAKMKEAVNAADIDVSDHKALLPISAINDATLVVKNGDGATALTIDKDYATYYSGEHLVVELMADGSAYTAEKVNVAYNKVTTDAVTSADIAAGIEAVDLCLTTLGVNPDLLCAPGFSQQSAIAAAMSAKVESVNGLFRGKALIDIDTGTNGARTYDEVYEKKITGAVVDPTELSPWPMWTFGGRKFHASTHLAGLMAQVDTSNGGCPYESPSNKALKIDGMCLEDGTEVNLTLEQANKLNSIGVITALNFMGGWVAWGNYTACYPTNTDVKDYFLPVSRMFDWVSNSLIKTFWSHLDKPMDRHLIDTILDNAKIWLNGLVGAKYLLGARIEMLEAENPEANLMAGIIKLHIYITPPSPAQEIDFVLEYDASYVTAALQA